MKRRLAVRLLAVVVCVVGAYQSGLYPASGQTPTPTSTGPFGSLAGRVFVDVDANGSFGGPDVPLVVPLELFLIDVSGPAFARVNSSNDGTYQFGDLPAGNYQLFINLPIASCVGSASPFTWVGDTFFGLGDCNPRLTTTLRDVTLMAGQNVTGVDFAQLPGSYDVTARIWLNAMPLSANTKVTIRVGGTDCWNARVNPTSTAAGVPVSFYVASINPSSDPSCQGGELRITIDGGPVGTSTSWDDFWKGSLFAFGPRPLYQSSDPFPFLQSTDVSAPPFQGISGQVVEAGTVTSENLSRQEGRLMPDGTEIRAFVGTMMCGAVKTKALRSAASQQYPAGQFGGNLFGLIVPPAGVKPGCGTPGAQVTFCVGDFVARQPAAGPFSAPGPSNPVTWEAPKRADITLEPTTEPCLAAPAPPPVPPERLPVQLPATGGRPGPARR